jgi:hypothetical protein
MMLPSPITLFRNVTQPDTTTIRIATPLCVASRWWVKSALDRYHVWWQIDHQRMEMNDKTAIEGRATVRVRNKAATWAEYIFLRHPYIRVLSPLKHPKNQRWAGQHQGKMPMPWDKQDPWVHPECKRNDIDGNPSPEPKKKATKRKPTSRKRGSDRGRHRQRRKRR